MDYTKRYFNTETMELLDNQAGCEKNNPPGLLA